MKLRSFSKRFYTFPDFLAAVEDLLDHLPDLRPAVKSRRVPRAFAEKIMLAVTRANGCRYCSFAHTRAALAAGIPEPELRKLLAGEYGDLPEHELAAVLFAQHWAEQEAHPDPEACRRLFDFYGPETGRAILATLCLITFGNLYGNTFDALLSRLAGRPASGSSLGSELGVLLGAFVLLPARLLARLFVRCLHRLTRPALVP
jgi:AhpD family alkylhydroperoxidase